MRRPQRRHWRRGQGAPPVRPAQREAEAPPSPQEDASHGEESSTSSHGTPPAERERGRAATRAAPAQPRRSQPRYERLRHRPARRGFSPQPSRGTSGAPPQQPQRDGSQDRSAGASPDGRKRPREASRSHSPSPQPCEARGAPPATLKPGPFARTADASSSSCRHPPQDVSSSGCSQKGRGKGQSRWNHAKGTGWYEKHRMRAVRHQERKAAGEVPDRNRVLGPVAAGQACKGCDGMNYYAFCCARKLCGTCCSLHPDGLCKPHREQRGIRA